MFRRIIIVAGLLLAVAVFADDQYQAIPESASGQIYPGDEVGGDILNPDAGWDGDFATFTEAASNGNTSHAITWETTEIYQIPVQAQNVRLHFKTEQYHYQSTSEVYAYNFPADQYDRLFIENGPDEAPLVSEQTLSLDPQYVSNGEVRVRVVLFAKHNSSAYARYYESEIVYMVALGQVNAIIVNPAAPDRIFVAANAVWKSADGGLEWTRMDLTPPWGPSCCSWVGSLIMDPNDSNTLYAGPGNGVYNIWKTTDGGGTWNELTIDPAIVANGATNLSVSDYAIDPAADILYASAYSGGPGMPIVSDVYASADGGASWQRTNLDIFADDLAFDPVQGRLFAATTQGIYAYSGGAWTQIGLAGENATSVAVAPDDPQTIYAGLGHTGVGGTEGAGLWKRAYDGAVWQWSDISIDLGIGPVRVASLALDPDDSNVIYAGTQWSNGLFKSADGGASWASIGPSQPVTWVSSVTLDPTDSDIVYAGTRIDGPGYADGQVYKVTDGGTTWTLLDVAEATATASVSVVVPEVTATHNEVIGIPVQIAGVSAPSIVSAEVFLGYDSSLLALDGVQTSGTLTDGWSIETNLVSGAETMKTLRIAAATDDQEITADGILFNVNFTVADRRSPASSPLLLEHVLLNDGDPANAPDDGSVTLVPGEGYVSVWCEDREGIVSGELTLAGARGQVLMGEELPEFLAVSEATAEDLQAVFAGVEAVSGPGELLRIAGVGPGDARLTRASFNGGRIGARWEGSAAAVSAPVSFSLYPNMPNPFNPETVIRFALARSSGVRLEVFDVVGQRVRVLVAERLPAGVHQVVWDGRGERGELVGSGVYLGRLQARYAGGEFIQVERMILLK